MRLIISDIGIDVGIEENHATVICLENPEVFSSINQDIFLQCGGEKGVVKIVDGDKILDLSKNMVYITNPFAVNCNEKKVITKLYQELNSVIQDKYLNEFNTANADILCLLDKVIDESPYSITCNLELDPISLFKTYELKITQSDGDMCMVLTDYLRAISSILGIKIVMFVNLKMYLTTEQCMEIYKFCYYNKIYLIDICGYVPYNVETEKMFIVDKDLCIIEM